MERDLGPKILIYSPYPLEGKANGVANYVTEYASHLEDEGFAVRLLGPNVPQDSINSADHVIGRGLSITRNETTARTSLLFNRRKAGAVIRTLKPDIVEFQEVGASNAAHTIISATPKREDGRALPIFVGKFHARAETLDRLTQTILFVAKHARRPTHKWGIPNGLTPGILNTVMGTLDGKIAISNATAKFWNDIYPDYYEVIYNGINTDELTPNGPKIDAWQDGKQTILFAGRHDERKGIEYLLDAYRLVLEARRGEIKLKITGEGKMTERLMQMARDMNLIDVEFLGILPREELVKAYRTADFLVAPSIGGEGFNRTIVEAEACGTLVIGSDIEGQREALNYQPFTRTFAPKDSHGLAREMVEILDLPEEEKQRLGQQAAEYVRRRFSWDVITKQNVKVYQRLISEHGLPTREDWPKKRR